MNVHVAGRGSLLTLSSSRRKCRAVTKFILVALTLLCATVQVRMISTFIVLIVPEPILEETAPWIRSLAVQTDDDLQGRSSIPPPPEGLDLAPIKLVSQDSDEWSPKILTFVAVNHTDDASMRNNNKPIFAIVTATRSTSEWSYDASETPLQKGLIESIAAHVRWEEAIKSWDIRLYVGVDDDDVFWTKHVQHLQIPSWLTLTVGFYPKRIANHIPFNEMARYAYQADRAEYFCRVNDDSVFSTPGWMTRGVETLQHYDPPNVGVVGPDCPDGKTDMLTHDMVHRTHMDIFEQNYYPPQFHNWWLDDWITYQYKGLTIGIDRSTKLSSMDWTVRHFQSVSRYRPDEADQKNLPAALAQGRISILRYLQEHYPNHNATMAVSHAVDHVLASHQMQPINNARVAKR